MKAYVRNRARPEGSIAEGYLADECLTFCSRYMNDIDTKLNRKGRNDDDDDGRTRSFSNLDIFRQLGRAIGRGNPQHLNFDEYDEMHHYVLKNCDELLEFVQ